MAFLPFPLSTRTFAALAVLTVPAMAAAPVGGGGNSTAPVTTNRIESLTLSSGGVAEIHRRAQVDGKGIVRIDVPLAQVDDILKSLVIRDAGGQVGGLILDGLSPVEETFGRLPFRPEDMGSLPALAAALQGVKIRVSSGGRTIEGMSLGVSNQAVTEGPITRNEQWVSVMTDTGQAQTLRMGADATLDILDAAMRDKLQQAAEVSGRGRTDTVRSIAIELSGKGERAVDIDYVVAAPVWKTAYRLMTTDQNTARLQAWAVLENASGEDWNGVTVTLSSGAPVMFSQALLERHWNTRQQLAVSASTATPGRLDNTAQTDAVRAEMAESAPAKRASSARAFAAPPPPPAPAPMMASAPISAPAGDTISQEGQTSASYRLPTPVTLQAGRTLSIPFIDAELPSERLSVFQPERRSVHPIAAVLMKNNTKSSLPPGILTVYHAQDGHVGDAQMPALPAGEERMASFAEDRKVTVTTESKPQEQITQVVLADGVLRATRLTRLATTYAIKGAADAPRTVLVEHQRRNGWTFTSDALTGATPSHHRLRTTVAAGGTAKIEAVAERSDVQQMTLLDADANALFRWSGNAADPKTAAQLKELAERRARLTQADAELEALGTEQEEAVANQGRIRENLSAVPADSSLGQRYTKALGEEEDRIAEIGKRRQQALSKVQTLRKELTAALTKT
ncbi:DUF4139 domain-containing protein [Pigmentiphaga aceris]|uniref:DUF4139 domain-containing protein n=1 Tax=Pigmentiphaga aceris TaxID=1940612 RepID=A0A5C0B0V5_9BURK|nr:DUF4139 domain-containing protein [Pigmentiphaga aceris]QEI08025.1 DUF4139 domain-containing protein [Pigmentiphaga aceris]